MSNTIKRVAVYDMASEAAELSSQAGNCERQQQQNCGQASHGPNGYIRAAGKSKARRPSLSRVSLRQIGVGPSRICADAILPKGHKKFRADDPFSHSFPRYLVRDDER
jgi:hypothetical protein